MPKRPRSIAEVRDKFGFPTQMVKPRNLRRPGGVTLQEKYERVAEVCKYLCEGLSVPQTVQALKKKHRWARSMTREDPYGYLRFACSEGWVRFRGKPHAAFAERIRRRHGWLRGVQVVHTLAVEDVAFEAAQMVLDFVRAYGKAGRANVHIGLGGGLSMRLFAKALADLLCWPGDHLPPKLTLHALAAGFDPNDPTTAPTAFFTYFVNQPLLQVEVGFIGLHAPSMVTPQILAQLDATEEICAARRATRELDIIVGTGADCKRHSSLYRHMKRSPRSQQALVEAGWVGDLLWRPLSLQGPITVPTEIRAMTVMELGDLPAQIARRKQVVLVLGPCGDCLRPRATVLRAVLAQPQPLITHLVTDTRTAARLVKEDRGAGSAGGS